MPQLNSGFYYNMEHESRGYFYTNIKVKRNQKLEENLSRWETEITRLGFNRINVPTHIPLTSYISREMQKEEKFSSCDCVALLNCVSGIEINKELQILKQFRIEKNHSLYGKPRILFFIYQVERRRRRSLIEIDGEPNISPDEADMLIIPMDVVDVSLAIEKICSALRFIENDTYIDDFLAKLFEYMKPDVITTHNTLTKHLSIGPKEIKENMQDESRDEAQNGIKK